MFGDRLLAQSMSLIYVQPPSSGLFAGREGIGNGYITSWVAGHVGDLGALTGPLKVVQEVSVGAQDLVILTRYRLPHWCVHVVAWEQDSCFSATADDWVRLVFSGWRPGSDVRCMEWNAGEAAKTEPGNANDVL